MLLPFHATTLRRNVLYLRIFYCDSMASLRRRVTLLFDFQDPFLIYFLLFMQHIFLHLRRQTITL